MNRIDPNEKQDLRYCIPIWLRDEQIKLAIKAVPGRIQAVPVPVDEPIALVSFGPSLNDTWEEIKQFKHVMTCSGSHRFLLDRGIVPTWHIEVDPRAHKVGLLGDPHPDTTYLPASACHPDYFKHLQGFKVLLWHIFDSAEDAERTLPHGEWAITGGCSVGLRTLTLARFLGFRDLHVFGMDGCYGPSGSHTTKHPNYGEAHSVVEYGGKEYATTPSMWGAAIATPHEVDQLTDCDVHFYGDGLVQDMMRDYVRKPPSDGAVIAMQKPELISAAYRDQNAQLHEENLAYGVGGGRHAPIVLKLVKELETHSVLDYGCGKGYLAKALPFPIWEYDPAIPEKSESPRPADLVVCTDVLEHIEPEYLDFVLDDLRRCVLKAGYFVIHTGPASKTLPDGRNTHLIQQSADWWLNRLSPYFKVQRSLMKIEGPLAHFVVLRGYTSTPARPKSRRKTRTEAASDNKPNRRHHAHPGRKKKARLPTAPLGQD